MPHMSKIYGSCFPYMQLYGVLQYRDFALPKPSNPPERNLILALIV